MDKLIKVKAMKRTYYEVDPVNRPGYGKLYLVGEEFLCEESRFSDYDDQKKGVKGHVVRGTMRRLDKPEPVAASAPVAKGKKG